MRWIGAVLAPGATNFFMLVPDGRMMVDFGQRTTANLEQISLVIERTRGNSDRFAETLRHEHIPHLSFSQITTAEFCDRRYYLQYIQLIDPHPIPDYFTKGKLLHQAIASTYEKAANHQEAEIDESFQIIANHYHGEHQHHLRNAAVVHMENVWRNCQVIAIEEAFAMHIHPDLPACVGVIDLILKQDGHFIVVDHKTGRDFYPQDELQMAIYVEYIRRHYQVNTCQFYYDHYRWVNNLKRIRKPAFQRTEVILAEDYWRQALARIQYGYQKIEKIKAAGQGDRNGECFRCPYRSVCR
jgi:CRISPR/Cas system-associated exonuclease Cas4 (RecB family)